MGFFKTKAEKKEERLERLRNNIDTFQQGDYHFENHQEVEKIMLSTTSEVSYDYETLGIIWSSIDTDAKKQMYELKHQAFDAGADAVIGITFQTIGETSSFKVDTDGNKWLNETFYFSEVKSRAFGTAIRYIYNENE